jgi:hypothetical protein
MAELTLQQITESGDQVDYANAGEAGDTVDNAGSTFLHIKNDGGETITVTIAAETTSVPNSIYGSLTKANASIAVEAAREAVIGPFKVSAFNNSDDEIEITYTAVTSVTIAAFYINASQL